MAFLVSSLTCYPVKSLGGVALESAQFDDFGIRWDRRFMLVDETGKFVTQRKFHQLKLLHARVREEGESVCLHIDGVSAAKFSAQLFCLDDFTETLTVQVWADRVQAKACSIEQSHALSDYLGIQVRLVFIEDDAFRQIDRNYFDQDKRVSFADGFPVLLTGEGSLNDLNAKLDMPVPMSRFRPNIVVSGTKPFQEDTWQQVKVGALEFAVVKPCSRCIMTTIDDAGERSKEPLRTLSQYRRNELGVCFGQNLVHLAQGQVALGDELLVIK